MPWEGEAGLVCGMEGTLAAWGSSPLAPGGLLHILLCLGDLKGLEVSVLWHQTLGSALCPRGLPSLEAESPRTPTQPLCRASSAPSLLLLPSQGKMEGWMYSCLCPEGCACLCSLLMLRRARPAAEVWEGQGHCTLATACPPLLRALTELQQPALPVGVEEGVGEVIAVILGDFEGLILDALVQILVQ